MRTKQTKLGLKEAVATKRDTAETQAPAQLATIASANARLVKETAERNTLISNMIALGESTNTKGVKLMETVTSLLANIATKAEQGEPIELMHINSVAAFMAGVEAMSDALPNASDEVKRSNTLRVLATAGLEGGQVNDATFPIVSLGARKEARHKAFAQILQAYMSGLTRGEPDGGEVVRAARELQMKVDRAMRSAMAPRSMAKTAPARQGTAP